MIWGSTVPAQQETTTTVYSENSTHLFFMLASLQLGVLQKKHGCM